MATVAARLALRRRGLDADAGRRRVTMAGRTISVTEGRALQFSGDGGDELPVATMTATMMTVVGRDGPRA
jgi:hypothetical protein